MKKMFIMSFVLIFALSFFCITASANRLYADVTSNTAYSEASPPRLVQDDLLQSAYYLNPTSKTEGENMYVLLDYGHMYLISGVEISFTCGTGKENLLLEYFDGNAWKVLKSGAFADAFKLTELYIMAEKIRLTSMQNVQIGINEFYVTVPFQTEVGYRKPVSANSTYQKKDEAWHSENLTDGHLEYGYSSNPYEKNTDASKAYTVTVDLEKEYALSHIAVYHHDMKTFPVEFEIQLSSDNKTYRTVATARDVQACSDTEGFAIGLNGEKGRFVRIKNNRMREQTRDGYLMQFAEMKIFRADSMDEGAIGLASEEISMSEGKTYMLVPHYAYPDDDVTYTYRSADESIVKVDPDGLLRAIEPGTTTVYIKDSIRGMEKPVYVTVNNKKFLYMAFYPPMPGYQTAEQYGYMKEAGMNSVLMCSWSHVTPQFANESLSAAAANGIDFYASDSRIDSVLDMSELELRSFVSEYKDKEGVRGYYVKDEPIGANQYANAYRIMADEDPDAVPHLNFYPRGAIEHFGFTYEGYIDDWVALLGPEYKHEISFDNYPFNNDAYNESVCMFHMELYNKYARKHDIDFKYYVQSVDLPAFGYNSNDNSVRYHFSIGLAYGAKGFQYFTWFTPQGTGEPYTSGSAIMKEDGTKGDSFEITKKTNENAKKVEPYLAPSEAIRIYHVGKLVSEETYLPKDFFFRVTNHENAIVSLFHNEAKNEYYILVVNKNYTVHSSTYDFLVEGATEVYDLTSGTPIPVTLNGNTFSADIEGGNYRLYGFNEGFACKVKEETNENKALDKPVYVSSSHGVHGRYAMHLTDTDTASVWTPTAGDTAPYALVDLKQDETIGYITLKTDADYAGSAKIMVSRDNVFFETISENVPLKAAGTALTFDRQKVRYIRVELPNHAVSLSNLCAYEREPIRISYQAQYIENGMAYLNTTGDFSDIAIVSAIYENGKMTDVRVLTPEELKNGKTSLFNVADKDNTIVKTFLLQNSVGSLLPYADTVDFSNGKLYTIREDFAYGYDSSVWQQMTNGSSSTDNGKLSGFAFSFGNKEALRIESGYTFSADVLAPKDKSDSNVWMSAGVSLRGDACVTPFWFSKGIMVVFRGNEMGIRTQISADGWNHIFKDGQSMMEIPVSFDSERKLIVEDNGNDEIKISAINDTGDTVVLGYVIIESTGATLYNADKTGAYGTASSDVVGGNHVSLFQHLNGATFDNVSLEYKK